MVPRRANPGVRLAQRLAQWRATGYGLAVGLVSLVTGGIGLIPTSLPLEHRSPLYLIAVLATGALCGRGPAIAAAVLSFVAFDWFFVAPAHTLHVADADQWQALLLLLLAAVVTGHLTAMLRERAELANRRERETVLLYEIGKSLAGAPSVEAGLVAATEHLRAGLALSASDVLLEEDGRLRPLSGRALERNDQAAALWVLTHATPAWRGEARGGTHRPARAGDAAGSRILLSPGARGAPGVAFLPLVVDGKAVGVLYAARGPDGRHGLGVPAAPQEDTRLLASACDQLALAVERGRLQRETVQTEVLKRTDALRAALLSSVSHDLRSPLAAIKAAAGSLLQRDVSWDDASRLAFAAQIEREADRLNRLVGNLLDLSRIEGGALVLDKQWYPLRELVDDTVARLQPVLAGHRVETAVDEALPPVLLDYLLIQQVLVNLLENAAKYAPAGTRIRISADTTGAEVRVRVADEGPGLPAAERQRVFERFYRVTRPPLGPPNQSAPHHSDDRFGISCGADWLPPGSSFGAPEGEVRALGVKQRSERPGKGRERPPLSAAAAGGPEGEDGRRAHPSPTRSTGLGLAVCAGFVAAHGGRIWAEPAEGGGRGAAFVFALPLPAPPAAPALPPTPALAALRDGARTSAVYRRPRPPSSGVS